MRFKMTIKELKYHLAQLNDELEVKIIDVWSAPTEDKCVFERDISHLNHCASTNTFDIWGKI